MVNSVLFELAPRIALQVWVRTIHKHVIVMVLEQTSHRIRFLNTKMVNLEVLSHVKNEENRKRYLDSTKVRKFPGWCCFLQKLTLLFFHQFNNHH